MWKAIYNFIKDHQLINAVIYIAMLIIMYCQLSISQKANFPQYAIINKDGIIILRKNFGEYGLYVEKILVNDKYGEYPIFIISFDKEPDYFEISNRDGAVSQIEHSGNKKYRLKLIGSGYGSPNSCMYFQNPCVLNLLGKPL